MIWQRTRNRGLCAADTAAERLSCRRTSWGPAWTRATSGIHHQAGPIHMSPRFSVIPSESRPRVQGIRPEAYDLAIRLVGAKRRRVIFLAQRAVLEKARLASPLIPIRTVQDGPLLA